jgi:CRISPR system Cascade subunit CasB
VLAIISVPRQYQGAWIGDQPRDAECAEHVALTLFALHQHSIRDALMHVGGCMLGDAIRPSARNGPGLRAVHRRFGALGTATAFVETLLHLRSLIRH